MTVKFLVLFLSLVVLIFVIDLIRREKLTFKYALGWLVVCVLAIAMDIFDRVFFKLAYGLGFELPSNFIFFSLLAVFVFLSLLMTIFLCEANKKNNIMAQRISILEHELADIKKKFAVRE